MEMWLSQGTPGLRVPREKEEGADWTTVMGADPGHQTIDKDQSLPLASHLL